MDNSAEARKYATILSLIDAYRNHRSDLNQTVSQLEAAIDALEEPPSAVRQEFLANWGLLEDVNAYSIVYGRSSLPRQSQEKVLKALDCLSSLTKDRLALLGNAYDR